MGSKHTIEELQQWQALPLNVKVLMTKDRIRQWVNEYGEDGVYVSFSGGKDSTVLLDLVRQSYPNVPAVFIDTGLEYPEIREFVKTFDNVEWIKPKYNFRKVIEKYGYPFISKEVSECVYGARKYLTQIIAESSLDRPTDRPTDRYRTSIGTRELLEQAHIRSIEANRHHPFQYETDRILGTCGQGKYRPKLRGGYDNKWRKARGIGEYSKRKNGEQIRRQQSKSGNHAGNADKRQGSSDKGEYP